MKLESSIVDPAVKEDVEGVNSESSINKTGKLQIAGPKLKPLYVGVPQILAPTLLAVSIAIYAQESSDEPIISLSTV